MKRSLLLLVVLWGLAVIAPSARADQTTIDFESGPPLRTAVTDEYEASGFVRFLQNDPGFRPYRTSAPGKARSGTVVADVGPDVCFLDGGVGSDCEFVTGGTTGRLTRSADAITLYAGLFEPPGAEVSAVLVAYSGETELASSAEVPLSDSGFTAPVTVSVPGGGIDRFELRLVGPGAIGAAIGFDDLTLQFPANSLPEVSLSVPPSTVAVLAGQSTDVPFDITRLNGSSGDLHFSVSGLPAGVTAEVLPNPLTGTGQSATLRLTAAPNAPAVVYPATITLIADPQGNGAVAQAPHSATLFLRVAQPYELRPGTAGGTNVALPACAPVDVPIVIARDQAFAGTVTLSLENLPAGVSAQILPSATIPPGGNLYAEATLRLSRTAGAILPANIVLRGSSPGLGDTTLTLRLTRASGTATLTSGLGLTPRHLTAGTRIEIDGSGFCPGTTVTVGNEFAVAPTEVAADGKSLTFNVPRLATTGPVTVVPPAPGAAYQTATPLTVESFRNTDGFSFKNPPFGSLSFGELVEAFGADDLFVQVNLCWPWSDCTVTTGFPNPIALRDWAALDVIAHETKGHCFGISRAVEQFLNGKVPYNRFAQVSSNFALPGPSGPSDSLMSYLDAQHVLQFSDEFASAWLLGRHATLAHQLATLHAELAAGRDPIVTIEGPSFGEGHALIAYDEEAAAAGGIDVYVYDNNRPFRPSENTEAEVHKTVETEESVIHFQPMALSGYYSWSFDMGASTWSGADQPLLGSDGNLFVAPQSIIPDNPSLPGFETLTAALAASIGFGSADGSVKTVGASGGAQFLPALDSHATPAGGGYWLTDKAGQPLAVKFKGVKSGHYSETFTAPGFAGSLLDVPTAAGVQDAATGAPGQVTFSGGIGRALDFALASQPGGGGGHAAGGSSGHASGDAHAAAAGAAQATTWSATLHTHASAHGQDTAGLTSSGALDYAHRGAPTTIAFTLSSVRLDGGPASFQSGPVLVASGDRLEVRPIGRDLARVRLTIRDRAGHTRNRTIGNRARPPARLRVTSLRGAGNGKVSVRVRISGLHGAGALGVALRLLRGGHTVARHAIGVAKVRNGTLSFSWRVPRKQRRGTYRLLANLRVSVAGTELRPSAGSVSAARRATVRLG